MNKKIIIIASTTIGFFALVLLAYKIMVMFTPLQTSILEKRFRNQVKLPADMSLNSSTCTNADLIDNPLAECHYDYSVTGTNKIAEFNQISQILEDQGFTVKKQLSTFDHVIFNPNAKGTSKNYVDKQQDIFAYSELFAFKQGNTSDKDNLKLEVSFQVPEDQGLEAINSELNTSIADKSARYISAPLEGIQIRVQGIVKWLP